MSTTFQAVAQPPPAVRVAEDSVVRAEHLTKRFGDLVAVDDLSFALERGTVTGFLGPNGAGKTTTLRMLLHLVEPTSGRALVFGGRYEGLEQPAGRVGAVLEAADFHPGRSGRDHCSRSRWRSVRPPAETVRSSAASGPREGGSTRRSSWSS
jgi:ABC-2 type transport system ATP-binding protein